MTQATIERKRARAVSFEAFSAHMERLADDLIRERGWNPTMVVLEQRTIRSSKLQECIDCGEAGTVEQESGLIKVVRSYWFCDECAAYWAAK